MQFTLIIGIVLALASVVLGYLIDGGHISALFLLSPFIIVFGGTVFAVVASFNLKDIISAFKAIAASLSKKADPDPNKLIDTIKELSETARKNGTLKLEEEMRSPELSGDEYLFLKAGLILIIEGRPQEEIQYVMESDIRAYTAQKQAEIAVFEGAAGYSPTMGVIGTVMGLIHVLSNMSDAEQLAAAIAIAFVATLYGVAFANLVYMPMASKLKTILKRQKIQREMTVDGVCMIAEGLSTRTIENRLSLYYQAFPGNNKKYKEGIEK